MSVIFCIFSCQFRYVGATKNSLFRTAHASQLRKEELSDWLAHRTFVALFVTVCRNNLNAVKYLLDNGNNLSLEGATWLTFSGI